MHKLILFRENNVDGCGGYAEVLVCTRMPVDTDTRDQLMQRLDTLKHNNDDMDTGDMVQTACDEILGQNAWEVVSYCEVDF